jgi:hypothetical protein
MQTILSLIAAATLSISSLFGILHSSTAMPVEGGVASSSSAASVAIATATATRNTVNASVLPAGSSWLTTLPLGDNKYSTVAPKKGYIYLCNVQSGGQGSQVNGPWIHGTTWTPSEKIHVEGSVAWPEATYAMKVLSGMRTIASNDLPTDHTTGTFPVAATDPAAKYDRNQGTIAAHSYFFSFPASPAALTTPGCIYGEVGIMNDGVLLFDGFDALYRDALAHELQDTHDGHPNNEGYHKHGFITDIKNVAVSQVVGFAFDGYPITGPLLPGGKYLTTNDLDECHGMTSSITLDGKTQSSYHYVLTQDFPYSVSCFHGSSKVTPQTLRAQGLETNTGTQAQSEANTMSANTKSLVQSAGVQGAGTPPAPPQEAITACVGKSSGASCSVGQQVSGTCATIGSYFACLPAQGR